LGFSPQPLYIGFLTWGKSMEIKRIITFLREIYVKKSKLKFHMEMLKSHVILYTQKFLRQKTMTVYKAT